MGKGLYERIHGKPAPGRSPKEPVVTPVKRDSMGNVETESPFTRLARERALPAKDLTA